MLNEREIASLLILTGFMGLALLVPGVRRSGWEMVKIIFGRQLFPLLLMYFAYAGGVIALGALGV